MQPNLFSILSHRVNDTLPCVLIFLPKGSEWLLRAFRFQYEEEVRRNPMNYDNWFDYVKLEEEGGDVDRVREVGGSLSGTWLRGQAIES